MKITFLGTGTSQGVPVIACNCKVCKSDSSLDKRLRTSILIEDGSYNYVIDAGPDFRQQMLNSDVQNLDAILLTHEHKDHTGGMDDVRAYNYKSKKPIDIFCDRRVETALLREYQYVFSEDPYPGAPQMNINTITDKPFFLNGRKVIPIKALHYKLPVYGFRFNSFTYLTDVNLIPDSSLSLIAESKYLVVNALRKEKHISHFNLSEALELISYIKPERAYITHIGHQMGLSEEVSAELPRNVFLAYDGMSIDVDD